MTVSNRNSGPVETNAGPIPPNTFALIGSILTCIAIVLCAVMFFLVERLPDDVLTFQQQLRTDTAAQFRLLVLGCSAAVLVLVGFVLCVVGLFLPHRPRLLAGMGAGVSLVLLFGVFGVLAVASLMNPDPPRPTENPGVTPDVSASAGTDPATP